MVIKKTIAVRFLDGIWQLFTIPLQAAPNGDHPTPLNLDYMFQDRSTHVRYKGTTRNGRLLYVEMNHLRKAPMAEGVKDRKGLHYGREFFTA